MQESFSNSKVIIIIVYSTSALEDPKESQISQKYALACGNEIGAENLFAYRPSVTPIIKMMVSILSTFKNGLLDDFFPTQFLA